MPALDADALAALQSLVPDQNDLNEPESGASQYSAGEQTTDLMEQQQIEPIETACAIATEVLKHPIVANISLADQGAGDLDVWAIIARIEQELKFHIPDSSVTPAVSIEQLIAAQSYN